MQSLCQQGTAHTIAKQLLLARRLPNQCQHLSKAARVQNMHTHQASKAGNARSAVQLYTSADQLCSCTRVHTYHPWNLTQSNFVTKLYNIHFPRWQCYCMRTWQDRTHITARHLLCYCFQVLVGQKHWGTGCHSASTLILLWFAAKRACILATLLRTAPGQLAIALTVRCC